jgi:hypothetical protein
MGTSPAAGHERPTGGLSRWVAWLLLALGLVGHVYAAYAMGGSRIAYTHHILGFALILLVTGGIIAALGHWFWRSRSALTFLIIGLVQAVFGVLVALEPFRAASGP